jgi:hypothetical protein
MTQDSSAAAGLVGAWNLLSWQIFDNEAPSASEPFGPAPVGLLQYNDNGWMSATMSIANRAKHPSGISPRRIEPAVLAQSYLSYVHYAGYWRVEGDQVIHSVRLSLNPNMIGSEQVRRMTFDAGKLTLEGIESFGDKQRRHELLWRRAEKEVTT